jgi:BolA-like protein
MGNPVSSMFSALTPAFASCDGSRYVHTSGFGGVFGQGEMLNPIQSRCMSHVRGCRKTTMQRHRMIYAALSEELENGLHALSLNTKTQAEILEAEAHTPQGTH